MIVNKYNKGGGSDSGVTPQDVQRQIDSALTPYWESGETKDYVDEAISGISLDGYYTSAQTEEAISAATAGKADAANVTARNSNIPSDGPLYIPKWNEEGIITGDGSNIYRQAFYVNGVAKTKIYKHNSQTIPPIYAPVSAGTAGEVLVSLGNGGAPVWSAMTFPTPDVDKAYVDSAITEVQDQIDTMDEVVSSALVDLKDKIDEISAATPSVDLSGYYTSAQTEDAISAKVESAYTILDTHITEVEQVTASALTELHEGLLEVSARTAPDMSLYTPTSGFSTINGSAITNGGNIVIQGGEGGNSNILLAITTDEEYAAISGSVKTGDLIQVYGVDINDDGESEYGLFQAAEVQEFEDQGVITKEIYWQRRDNADSLFWADKDYPWLTDNDIYPVDFGLGSFLISLAEGGYNGIGFDGEGKAVITHIVPEEDEQTGEITGMTRTDRDFLGELDIIDEVVSSALVDLKDKIDEISAATPSVDLSGYYTSAQTEQAITSKNYVTSAQVETQITSKNYITSAALAPYATTGDVNTLSGVVESLSGSVDTLSANTSAYTTHEEFDTWYPAAACNLLVDAGIAVQTSAHNYGVETSAVTSDYVNRIWKGTQAEYDLISVKDPYTFYIIINNN